MAVGGQAGDNVEMEAEKSHEGRDGVLFSYQPEGSFTRTMGWLFVLLPLIGVVAGFIDLFGGQAIRVVLLEFGLSLALAGLLYLASRSVDHMQERIRVEVLSDGVLRFRNFVGMVREVPLRRAQSLEIKDLRGKPKIVSTSADGRRRNPFSSDTELRGQSGDRRSPHFTQICVRDQQGKRHVVTLSGGMPIKDVRRLNDAMKFAQEI
jgi:hypothetical protein